MLMKAKVRTTLYHRSFECILYPYFPPAVIYWCSQVMLIVSHVAIITQNIAGCSGSIPVAVKTLSSRDLNVIQKFMEEVELMKRFTHPNIVGLLGKLDSIQHSAL